ncbi:Galaxin [Oryzias melastigma]|uniref:Galaxin n=1 Tax=Oryzias melastigma TaxID=30732 RepID=A0A834FM46_ORYME|nr:Galaxin [Oryzias melastigma]
MAQCCGKDAFDVKTQLCCGPTDDKKILKRISDHHQCCGHEQFNEQTQCCSDDLKVENHTNCDNKTTGRTSVMGQCGTSQYNVSSQLCCGPEHDKKILRKNSPNNQCCGHKQFNKQTQHCSDDLEVVNITNCGNKTTDTFDVKTQLCCGPTDDKKILNRISDHHQCCGHEQFNEQTQCCSDDLKVENHTNCDHKTTGNTSVMEQCGNGQYNKTEELCCGPHGSKIILKKTSENHSCCGHNQYNTKNQCCTDALEIHNCSSNNCSQDACVPLEKHKCKRSNPNSCYCSSKCIKPHRCSCCERSHTKSLLHYLSGRQSKPIMCNPKEKICCNGCVSDRKPWMDQCCGVTPGVLCCNNTLHKDVQGQHCCGSSVYDPAKQICCNGHSYPKTFFHCCGKSAYNISDPLKKCCGGTLYNLTKEQSNDAQCCGSLP